MFTSCWDPCRDSCALKYTKNDIASALWQPYVAACGSLRARRAEKVVHMCPMSYVVCGTQPVAACAPVGRERWYMYGFRFVTRTATDGWVGQPRQGLGHRFAAAWVRRAVCLSIYLSFYLSKQRKVSISINLSIYLSIYRSIILSIPGTPPARYGYPPASEIRATPSRKLAYRER